MDQCAMERWHEDQKVFINPYHTHWSFVLPGEEK